MINENINIVLMHVYRIFDIDFANLIYKRYFQFMLFFCRKSFERQIRDLKNDLELERQTIADYLKHKARMTDLLAQLQAQIEVLSAVCISNIIASPILVFQACTTDHRSIFSVFR